MQDYQLAVGCDPVVVWPKTRAHGNVDVPPALTAYNLGQLAAARLQAAGLLSGEAPAWENEAVLLVSLELTPHVFGLEVEYNRLMPDIGTGQLGRATSWDVGALGLHGMRSAEVLTQLRRLLDVFIVAYKQANGPLCEGTL